MRVTDNLIQNSFLKNFNSVKEEINKLQNQISSGSKINKPSDSPLGTTRVIKFNEQLSSIATFIKNIDNASAFVGETINSLQGIQDQITAMTVDLVNLNNTANMDSFESYSQKMDNYLSSILDFANSQYEGQYLFSGSDFSSKPFGYNSSGDSIDVKLKDIGAERKVKISNGIDQKININGEELFNSVLKQSGNFDVNAAAGSQVNKQVEILDAEGNKYKLNLVYTKTADHSYDLQYNIVDTSNNTVFQDTKQLVFNSTTGALQSIDGNTPAKINVDIPANKIKIVFNVLSLNESTNSTSINSSLNQKADVLNTILTIKNNLKNGIKPNDNQTAIINDFNKHLLDKLSEIGIISNKLSDTNDILKNQELQVKGLRSKVKDTDVAEAIIDLQNQQNMLDISYKMSSKIFQKSLIDFL